jgi:anti-sigma factor RsiW
MLAVVTGRRMRVEHLSESEISGFLDHDLSDAERSSVESHLQVCATCRAAIVEVSRMTDSYLTSVDGPLAEAAKRNRWRRRIPAILGAAAAATFAIVVAGKRLDRSPSESMRSGPTVAADSRPVLEVVGPPELVARGDSALAFAWRSANTASYRFAILDDTGNPVFERELSDTVIHLPRASLERGRLYFWRVDAIADGVSATTGARKLTLAK